MHEKRKKPAIMADQTQPEYSTNTPTHAGGVVIRREGVNIQYLVVQTKKEPREWVLPKGHIEGGESMEQAVHLPDSNGA